jgi:hypothetical protein
MQACECLTFRNVIWMNDNVLQTHFLLTIRINIHVYSTEQDPFVPKDHVVSQELCIQELIIASPTSRAIGCVQGDVSNSV